MRCCLVFFLLSLLPCSLLAQQPVLDYVCELKVTCGNPYTIGATSHGRRVVIPITGGSFDGPAIKGIVVAGGADYQLVDTLRHRTELEAIYDIVTDDGVYIHVRNTGVLCSGDGDVYFMTTPKFEAPADSKYAFLNNAVFVCKPEGRRGYISLKVWMVK